CSHCLEHMNQAAALYQGELLAGLSLKEAYPFEEWLALQREQLQHQMLTLLDKLAFALETRGEYGLAQQQVTHHLALAPWHESAHRHLMRLYMHQGDRTAALAQYKSCCDLLASELNVAPAAETKLLWQQIRDETFETAVSPQKATVTHNFPVSLTPFVGRKVLLDQIRTQLADENCRLLTLLGAGGSGKTRLSIEIGQTLAQRQYRDGIYFISLVGISDVALLVTTIAEQLGLKLADKLLPQQQLLDYLHPKELLLVCDNFEQILAGASLLATIISQAPTVQFLVTSREPLNIQAEWRQPIGGLEYKSGTTSEAVLFFQQSARRIAPQFQWSDKELTAVRDLCRLVNGLPLALELAATWTRLMDCRTILRETKRNLDFLTSPLGDLPTRHQSIRAVLTQSWQLLSPRLQKILNQLAYFAGRFGLEEALAIVPQITMLDIATLLDKSLLQWLSNGRYQMHQLLRQFALPNLAADPTTAAELARRHSDYYLTFAARQEAALVRVGAPKAMAALQAAAANMRLAWQTAVSQQNWPLLQASLQSLATYSLFGGYGVELERWVTEILAQMQTAVSPPPLYGFLLDQLGQFYVHQGRYDEAIDLAERLHAFGRQQQTEQFVMLAHIIHGNANHYQANYQAALDDYKTAIVYFENNGDDDKQALLNGFIGHTYYHQGDHERAITQQQLALAQSQASGNMLLQARCLLNLGHAQTTYRNVEQGFTTYQRALETYQALGFLEGIAGALHGLGRIHTWQGRLDEALRCYQEALRIVEKRGMRRDISLSLNSIGLIYKRLEAYDKAIDYINRALQMNRVLGSKDEIVNNLGNLGSLYNRQEKYELAETHLREAVALAKAINYQQGVAGSLGNLASYYKDRGQLIEALAAYEGAIDLSQQLKLQYFLSVCFIEQADILLQLDRLTEAECALANGLQNVQAVGNDEMIPVAQELQRQIAAKRKNGQM
ncbi:MAG: tetratricopeptide repeat protein, partial [Chloroflexota bacterium]